MIVKTAANLQNSPLSYILFFVNKTKNVDNPTVIHKLLINLPRVLLFFLRFACYFIFYSYFCSMFKEYKFTIFAVIIFGIIIAFGLKGAAKQQETTVERLEIPLLTHY